MSFHFFYGALTKSETQAPYRCNENLMNYLKALINLACIGRKYTKGTQFFTLKNHTFKQINFKITI